MSSLLATLIGGAQAPALPPGCIRVHRIATEEEDREDAGGGSDRRCASCDVLKPIDQYYVHPTGQRFRLCKTCTARERARRTAERRARA